MGITESAAAATEGMQIVDSIDGLSNPEILNPA
jgi:hypothetical protein